MSRCTRANSASASASTWSAVEPASSSSSSLRQNFSLPEPPVAGGARQQFAFEKLLIILQRRGDRCGGGLQLDRAAASRRRARRCPSRKRQSRRGSGGWPFRESVSADASASAFAVAMIARNLRHAGDAVRDVRFLRQRGLRQQQIDAVVDVVVVSARVFLEGVRVFRQPDLRFQIVLEDFEINLRRRARASRNPPASAVPSASCARAPASRRAPCVERSSSRWSNR